MCQTSLDSRESNLNMAEPPPPRDSYVQPFKELAKEVLLKLDELKAYIQDLEVLPDIHQALV